jgi:type II secretory pathway pseudopilin PulG
MNPAAKAFTYGILTFLEITVVVLFVMSLAAIAVISSLGARKRNRALENANALCLIGSASDHHVTDRQR